MVTYSDDQARVAENLALVYEALLAILRAEVPAPTRMAWKQISGREYLYEIRDRVGNGRSLGPRSNETEASYSEYLSSKIEREGWETRLRDLQPRIREIAAQYRALKLPILDEMPGRIFREIDRRGLYSRLQVAGTNCMAAYELESQAPFDRALSATADCDFTLNYGQARRAGFNEAGPSLIEVLKGIDDTFTENMEKPFQARNAKGYEVEFLLGASELQLHPASERIRPIPLSEQDWLLRGRQVQQVVLDRTGQPARIVAPDPRWLALHKLWLANKPERKRTKVEKDWKQGLELLRLVTERMEHFPLDDRFRKELPPDLAPYLDAYLSGKLNGSNRVSLAPAKPGGATYEMGPRG